MIKYLLFIPFIILSQNNLYLYPSYIFEGTDAKIDIYYGFETNVLYENYLLNDSIECKLVLMDSASTKKLFETSKKFYIQSDIQKNKIFFDKFKVQALRNKYNLKIEILQKNKIVFERQKYLNTHLKSDNSIHATPILLANSIKTITNAADVEDKYNFNGIYLEPNLSQLYTLGNNNALFWYFEVYNVQGQQLSLDIEFLNTSKNSVETNFTKVYKNQNGYVPVTGVYNVIAKLNSGEYQLRFKHEGKIINSVSFTVFKKSKKKFNVDKIKESLMFTNLEEETYLLKYLMHKDQYVLYANSGETEKIKIMNEFWLANANSVNMSLKELRQLILERVKFIKENYRSINAKNILLTDAASILIKYGLPYSIEKSPTSSSLRAYEIWYYNNNSQVSNLIFVLGDLDGFGELKLLHTNHPQETRYNVNWKERLRTNSYNKSLFESSDF